MTLDASALVAIARKEPGYERLVAQIVHDRNPRIAATAVAEAGILLSAGKYDPIVIMTLTTVVDELKLTVVPFTRQHWREAVMAHLGDDGHPKPRRARFGRSLSAAVAATLGAELVSVEREGPSRVK